jgi:biotin transport system permease protein
MIGLYSPRLSIIHAIPAGWKLLVLLAMSVVVVKLSSATVLGVLVLGCVGVGAIARLPLSVVLAQLKPVLWMLLALFLVHGLLTSWHIGAVVALRFLLLILLALLVTLTTRLSDLMAVLERVLAPLRWVGLPPAQVSFMLTLAIRFIPVLQQQAHEIREAQWARGVDRNPLALLVPLLVRTLHLADALTDALDARGYEGE